MLARQLGKEGILRCVSLYRNSKHRQPPSIPGHSEQTLTAYEQVFQKVFKYIGAVAHKACGLPDRLALIGLLSKLKLIGSDTGYACLLQHFEDTILIPRCGIGRVFMQEQSTLGYLLAIQLAHPRKMNAPRLLLRLDNLGVALLVVDVLPGAERSAHGCAHQQCGFLLIEQPLRLQPHARPGEIPWFTVLVRYGEIQS